MPALLLALFLAQVVPAQAPEPNGGGVRPGVLPKQWITGGPNCAEVPKWQVHEYNSDFCILRESGCTNYEKPFLYILFGKDKILLVDTGAGQTDVTRIVTEVIAKWMQKTHRESVELIVGHSHSHGDHKSGDAQFKALHNPAIPATLIPLTVEGTAKFFGIEKWPETAGQVDLGERVVDVLPIPGHDVLSLAYYDRQTGVLLTGDSLYPGRLYVADFPAFVRSSQRLATFAEGKIVSHVLGCHIEESATPYLDYPIGTKYQPEEHSLELSGAHILELNKALLSMNGKPVRMAMRDYTIWPK